MSRKIAWRGASLFDGEARLEGQALLVEDGTIEGLVSADAVPPGYAPIELDGGLLAPGFIDLQVNGGGGVLFNAQPDVAGIMAICAAHAPFGTTALLPTLITDAPDVMAAGIAAVRDAVATQVPGCLGLHLEGPFIAPARQGAHDPAFIREPNAADLAALRDTGLAHVMLTLAPEIVPPAVITALARAGVTVSLGHSGASYATAMAAAEAGAACVTHLFNAMSQLGHRSPGLVGAALDCSTLSCGLIADGHHVHPAAMALALRGKAGPGRIFLVSDAMPTVGTADLGFKLHGRTVRRDGNRLTLEDGTLAGAHLTMIEAVRYVTGTLCLPLETALRMATLDPAQIMRIANRYGRLAPGARADLVHLDDALEVQAVWIDGISIERALPSRALPPRT